MASRRNGAHRFFLFPLSALLFPAAALADTDLSEASSIVSTIITLGLAAFGVLALYVLFLTGRFLLAVFKESMQARKEAQAHAVHVEKEAGKTVLSAAFGLSALFSLLALLILFAAFLILTSGMDFSFNIGLVKFVISAAVSGFALLSLYMVYLALSVLWKVAFKPAVHAEGEPMEGLPGGPAVTRRSFLSLLGWAWVAFTAASMGALTTVLRFFFPNVTFEPPTKFKGGLPETYAIGVDERFKDAYRCWIVRNNQGFYALSTICTHLGCTPNWLQAEQKFKCPCHGSGYYITGVNFEGPAPRPLPRFNITLADDGQLLVDESVQYQQELGQWGLPGSFLKLL